MRRVQLYNGDVPDLILPEHIASWDVVSYWERERYDSMAAHLGSDDCLWVVGAEHGYMAALWSRLCGSTVLIEPSPPFWRNIRLTWEANGLAKPVAMVQAFLADERVLGAAPRADWPDCAYPDEECPTQEYRYLFNEKHAAEIPITTVDDLVARGAPPPTALSVDTEGAEVRVLPGARRTLEERNVKCWISIHPDLIARDYSPATDRDVHRFMESVGYRGEHIATDHEQHWLFAK